MSVRLISRNRVQLFACVTVSVTMAISLFAPAALARADVFRATIGFHASSIAIDAANHRVFVATDHDDLVSWFDGTRGGSPVSQIKVGDEPVAIAIDSSSHRVFVANAASRSISMFDGSSDSPVIKSIALMGAPSGIAVDTLTHTVMVTSATTDTVFEFDGSSASPSVTSLSVPRGPSGITIDSEARRAFIGNSQSNTVSRIDLTSNTIDQLTTTAYYPGSITLDETTRTVFVGGSLDNAVYGFKEDETTSSKRVTLSGADEPSLAVDPTSHDVYVGGNYLRYFDGTNPSPLLLDTDSRHRSSVVAVDAETHAAFSVDTEAMSGLDNVWIVTPQPARAPIITPANLAPIHLGTATSIQFITSGNPSPRVLTISGEVPPGMTWTPGLLAGAPTSTGSYSLSLTTSNGVGDPVTTSYTLTITPPPPVIASQGDVPLATVGSNYRFGLTDSELYTIHCAVTAGRLPTGIRLDESSCTLAGIPTSAGSWVVDVEASNSGGSTDAEYLLVVAPRATGGCSSASPDDRPFCPSR